MIYLGIDWGEKRIGLALGDSEVKLATPFKVVSDINEVIQIIKKEDIDIVVIGLPLKMNGESKEVSSGFIKFVDLLKEKLSIPVKTIDERLTSKAADVLASDRKTTLPSLKLRRTKAPQDAIAAMLILQSYLDKLNKDD